MAAVTGLRHVTITVASVATSAAFYDAALAELGLSRVQEFADEEEDPSSVPLEAVGYGPADGDAALWLLAGSPPTARAHVAFAAGSRQAVDAFYAAALAHGGTARQAPRRWEIYRPGYYGALVGDPDGNLVEAACDE